MTKTRRRKPQPGPAHRRRQADRLHDQPRRWDPYLDDVPLPSAVYDVAWVTGLRPADLDHHVEAVHGWEPHDRGYRSAVVSAAGCLINGGCA